jgi:hypothetical protein
MAGRLALAAVGVVEEARQGLRQLLAVVGVGDEVAPRRGNALEAADRLDRQPRQDQEDVVSEAVRWVAPPRLLGGRRHCRFGKRRRLSGKGERKKRNEKRGPSSTGEAQKDHFLRASPWPLFKFCGFACKTSESKPPSHPE